MDCDFTALQEHLAASVDARYMLVEAILRLPLVHRMGRRDAIVQDLPAAISSSVIHDDSPKGHVNNIVFACAQHTGGVANLLAIIEFHYDQTDGYKALCNTLARLASRSSLKSPSFDAGMGAVVMPPHGGEPERSNSVSGFMPSDPSEPVRSVTWKDLGDVQQPGRASVCGVGFIDVMRQDMDDAHGLGGNVILRLVNASAITDTVPVYRITNMIRVCLLWVDRASLGCHL